MAERFIKDSSGKPIELKEGEEVITTGAFVVVSSSPNRDRILAELLGRPGQDPFYDESSLRIIPGGKNGRVTVVAKRNL